MRVLRYKSAKYSIERPLHIGAALAGGRRRRSLDADRRSACRSARRSSSATTCSGCSATPRSPASRPGDDLIEGKRTVLVALALQQRLPTRTRSCSTTPSARPSTTRGAGAAPDHRGSGAHAEVERRIDELTTRSLAALDEAPVTDVAREVLRQLASAATQRVI